MRSTGCQTLCPTPCPTLTQTSYAKLTGTSGTTKKQVPKGPRKTFPGRLLRTPDMIADVTFNSLLIICQSLRPKLDSLASNFKMNKSVVALLTETWFNKGNKKLREDLIKLEQAHDIKILRKDRNSRGGGVALAFDSSKCEDGGYFGSLGENQWNKKGPYCTDLLYTTFLQ